MGFRPKAYATVWGIESGKGNFTKVRLSISRKNKDGEYEQDFAGFCTFIGTAHAKANKLKERDRIQLGDIDVSNTYDAEKKKEYVNYKVFDFEYASSGATPDGSAGAMKGNPVEGDEDDESPF